LRAATAPLPSPSPTRFFRRSEAPAVSLSSVSAPTRPYVRPTPLGRGAVAALAFAALGVVYGDIGTSPLYALRECFHGGTHVIGVNRDNVLGVLSLVFWALILVVCIKYLYFLVRIDNRGEGGILALVALLGRKESARGRRAFLIALGAFGAAMLYGDGMITPVITVFGAIEGVDVATPALKDWVVPVTVVILVALFLFQRRGTAGVAKVFAPITLVWFVAIAATGLHELTKDFSVLAALNPWYGLRVIGALGPQTLGLLGSVVLVVTGAEALYADLGHFGKGPIRIAWYVVALPALLLNYFGQGAKLLADPSAAKNPFYAIVPQHPVAIWTMILIATAAAIVASQALISGAFSLTRQAMQLGYSPRVTIVHTSDEHSGQIFIPEVNAALMVGCVGLAIGFRSSANIAAAYGVTVTGTMLITTLLFYAVARDRWKWSRFRTRLVTGVFLAVDLALLAANLTKIDDGGWFTIVVAGAVFYVMTTWQRGRARLAEATRRQSLPLELFIKDLEAKRPHRVKGAAVFMTSNPDGVPLTLLHHLRHNQVLHQRVLLVSVITDEIPEVAEEERIGHDALGHGLHQVIVRYGFMQTPNVMKALMRLNDVGVPFDPEETTFYLGRMTLLPTVSRKMGRFRKRLFVFLHRNAPSATVFYGLPPSRVVEVGAQVEL
jgi:KUP system potassium uptake protein